ncbi:SRPBCC family protein [Mucilaginibacter ginsenosidivorans]|uniref:SRPBCC family protein n=1 Tax=Mucilaginibacter ginsenosidivorans TaxID=398053 RepID=A0A5B8URW6_9SPHI|nr:SRPBCC family protein [Mucilaginibacter ginsenosidivorans]QEC61465.1 SRPBCC family protein [Mucilaginibacter ginsenosidivorans]
MTILTNEVTIHAPIEKIWKALTNVEALELYDPTVRKSTAIGSEKSGPGAKRRVEMMDGKNWFEEKVTIFKPNEALSYELTACSFPVERLNHRYSFEISDGRVKVKQVMQYQVKFGLFGKLLDTLMIRKQSDKGIKKFMAGLKSYVEKG